LLRHNVSRNDRLLRHNVSRNDRLLRHNVSRNDICRQYYYQTDVSLIINKINYILKCQIMF